MRLDWFQPCSSGRADESAGSRQCGARGGEGMAAPSMRHRSSVCVDEKQRWRTGTQASVFARCCDASPGVVLMHVRRVAVKVGGACSSHGPRPAEDGRRQGCSCPEAALRSGAHAAPSGRRRGAEVSS
jgi:hypothetical protein